MKRAMPAKLPDKGLTTTAMLFATRWLSYLLVAGGIAVIVFAVYTVTIVNTPLPWVDQWAFLQELVGNHGRYSLELLWRQHNDHRIPLPKLFYLVDLYLFHGKNTFLLVVILLFQLLHVGVVAMIFRRVGGFKGATWWTSVALACTALFALRQAENFWFGSDLPLVLMNLGATVAFGSAGLYRLSIDQGKTSLRYLVLACAGALTSSLSLTNGLMLWPMLILMLLVWRTPSRLIWTIAAVTAALWLAWIPGYHTASTLQRPPFLRLGSFVLLLFGSSWSCVSETLGVVLAGVAIPGVVISYLWELWRKGSDRLAVVLLSIAVFSLGSSVLIALGRAAFGLGYARTDRYQTAAMLFWACVFALVLRKLSALRSRVPLVGFQVAFAGVLLAAARISPFVAAGAHVHADGKRAAAVALQLGVKDWPVIAYVTTPPRTGDDLIVMCDFLRAHRWSIFADGERYPLGRNFRRYYREVPATRCEGYVETVKPVPDYRLPGFSFSGWAYSKEGGKAVEAVVLIDPSGRIVGLGSSGFRRTDIPFVVRGVTSLDIGYRGYVPADLIAPEALPFAILPDGISACQLSANPINFDWRAVAYSGPRPTGATLTMTGEAQLPVMNLERIGDHAPDSAHPVALAADRATTVSGWILDPSMHPGDGADLVVDDVPIAARYGFDRPDVAAAFHSPEASRCGFAAELPGLRAGEHTISVRVIEPGQLRYFQGGTTKIAVR